MRVISRWAPPSHSLSLARARSRCVCLELELRGAQRALGPAGSGLTPGMRMCLCSP